MTANRYPGPQDPQWMLRGICADEPDLMSPHEDDAKGIEAARRICSNCPVKADCIAAAMAAEIGVTAQQRDGIRGGYTPGERYAAYRNRRPLKVKKPRPAPKPKKEPAPKGPKPINHGTRQGAVVHRRRGQDPCEDCLTAERAYRREYYAAQVAAVGRTVKKHAPAECGTVRAAWQHQRRGEDMCPPCREAYNAKRREYREAAQARQRVAA